MYERDADIIISGLLAGAHNLDPTTSHFGRFRNPVIAITVNKEH